MKDPHKRFAEAIADYRNILICLKGSPDPDALAAAHGLKLLCDKHGKSAKIVATQKLSLKQNKLFAERLMLSFEVAPSFDKHLRWADTYIVVDHPSPTIEGLSGQLPCSAHIDHHEKVRPPVPIGMRWCTTTAGSTSTLVSTILADCHRELNISLGELERVATALLFGLQTDTNKYALATEEDQAAIEFLSQFANESILRELDGVPLSGSTAARLQLAEQNKEIYKGWLITGVEFVPEKQRDDIAIVADFLVRREDVELVIVFAVIEDERNEKLTLDASIRTKNPELKLTPLIRRIASNGGGRKAKGAYQVNMDYFASFNDKALLWTLVAKATVERLKRTRDATYIAKLHGMVENARGAFGGIYEGLLGAIRQARRKAPETTDKKES
jgi:nanoRNase/pAp phosphatase (c-di-AMP/oligoRNAs hydrolase)